MRFLLTLLFVWSLLPAVEVGQDLSQLRLPLRSGAMTVGDLHGKVVYLDIWASWCSPCRDSFAWMNQLQHSHGDAVQVVAVSIDNDTANLENFLKRHPADFQIGHDPDLGIARELQVPTMPTAYLIDKKGVLRLVHKGFRTQDPAELSHFIDTLLQEDG